MKASQLRKIIREEIQNVLTEADIIPVGPDGNQITDPAVIKNLNMALKAVDATLRKRLTDIITDPNAAKSLRNPAQRVAMIGAMAITFGIDENEFSQIVNKIKGVLKKSGTSDQA